MKYLAKIGEEQFTIDINQAGQITINDELIEVDMRQMKDTTMYSLIIEGISYDVRLHEGDEVYGVEMSGNLFEVVVEDERTRRLAGLKSQSDGMTGEATIKAPMPGVVVDVPVTEGQPVQKGDIVVILESMKMQNEFKAPRDGEITVIRVAPGDKVDQNAVLLTIG